MRRFYKHTLCILENFRLANQHLHHGLLIAVRSFIRTTHSLFPLHLYFLPARTMVDRSTNLLVSKYASLCQGVHDDAEDEQSHRAKRWCVLMRFQPIWEKRLDPCV